MFATITGGLSSEYPEAQEYHFLSGATKRANILHNDIGDKCQVIADYGLSTEQVVFETN